MPLAQIYLLERRDEVQKSAAIEKVTDALVRRVGVDETARRRGQRYLMLFHDLDRHRLLFAAPGPDQTTFT